MNQNKLRWIVYFIIVAVLCMSMYLVSGNRKLLSDTFLNIYGWMVIDAFVLVVVYAISRKLKTVAFWKFVVYFAFAATGSICINFLLPVNKLQISPFFTSGNFLFFALGDFLLLAFLNFVLSRIVFGVSIREGCLIGIFMASINMLNLPAFPKSMP